MKSVADPSTGWGGPGVFCEDGLQGNKILRKTLKMEIKTKGINFSPLQSRRFSCSIITGHLCHELPQTQKISLHEERIISAFSPSTHHLQHSAVIYQHQLHSLAQKPGEEQLQKCLFSIFPRGISQHALSYSITLLHGAQGAAPLAQPSSQGWRFGELCPPLKPEPCCSALRAP